MFIEQLIKAQFYACNADWDEEGTACCCEIQPAELLFFILF